MITTKNFIRYSILTGLFIIPFIPFIVPSNMFFPFITGKGFTFRILVDLIFGLFVALALFDPVYRPKLTWISKSVLLFASIILLADLFGVNSYKSIWSNYERMEGFVLIAHLVLYYFVVSSVLNTKDLWNKFLNTHIVASVIMSIYGLFQISGLATINQGGTRVDATFGNAAYLAIYLVFNIFLCLYFLFEPNSPKWHKYLYGPAILLQSVILYYTATRGAILGIIGGLFISAVLVLWKERDNRIVKRTFTYLLGGLVVFVLFFYMFRNTETVKNNPVLSRFSTLSFSEFKTQGRYYVWPMALKGIAERPILGWGQENFNFVFNKNYNPNMFGQEEWFDRTHNLALDWLIAGGVLGFGSYVLIYIALFYYIWRRGSALTNVQKSILSGLVVAYVFHNMFVFDNLISYIMFYSILGFIHFQNKDTVQTSSRFYTSTFRKETLDYVVLPVVVVFTIGLVYFVNIPALSANIKLIQAMSPKQAGVDENLKLFKEVFDANSFGSAEAIEQLVNTSTQIIGATSGITDSQKKAFFELSKAKLDEKVANSPHDARYLVFAGSFYNRFSQYDEAIKYLEKAMIESPNKQTIIFELGTSYLGKGDAEKTLSLFKQAYELKPTMKESTILYALSAIYAKNQTVLKEISQKLDDDTIIFDNRFANAYQAIGDYGSVQNILKARLLKDPKNRDNQLKLAAFYATIGQKQNAINIIQQIINEDPSFKAQGESYIKEIQNS